MVETLRVDGGAAGLGRGDLRAGHAHARADARRWCGSPTTPWPPTTPSTSCSHRRGRSPCCWPRPAAAGADDTYLRRALAIGESPRFDVTATTVDQLTDDALAGASVLIVHDAPLGDAVAGRVLRFAERGGGVFLIAGARASWPQIAGFPGTLAAPVDRSRGEVGRLGGLEFGHAVFAPFRAARSGDFSSVRVYGYRRLTAADAAQVLARYDDGLPALAVTPAGRGKVMVWTSSVDLGWNDLALKPVFLPFVHQVVRTLAGFEERPAALTVGQVATPETPADPARPRVAVGPDAGAHAARRRPAATPSRWRQPGFYEVRGAGTDGATTARSWRPTSTWRSLISPASIRPS